MNKPFTRVYIWKRMKHRINNYIREHSFGSTLLIFVVVILEAVGCNLQKYNKLC